MSKAHLDQIRKLSIALFVSGAFNIILFALVLFWMLEERPPTPYFEQKPLIPKTSHATPSSAELLHRYKAKTYEQLLPVLERTKLVENGYTERDLALGVLVTFHDFDLERALGNIPPKKMLSFDEGKDKVIVYPNLTNKHFETLAHFIKIEKWPFKPKGLFFLLKNRPQDPSLKEAFYLTSEFTSLEALFKGITREDLLQMIVEGGWGLVSAFNEKQRTLQDLSDENRQKLLLSYMQAGSEMAAYILLKTDFDFALKRLSDAAILSIIRKLHQSREAARFLSSLLSSPRGDEVKSLARNRYQELTGQTWEPLISRETKAPVIILPKKEETPPPKIAVRTPPIKKSLLYIVQDGDTLWKIAKQFKVPIEEIRALNQLKKDALKPGDPLKIPAS